MLRGTVFIAPVGSGTEGVHEFDDTWVSMGTPDDYMEILEPVAAASQIVGFTNEDPSTVNFANVINGTKKGHWILSYAGVVSNYVKFQIPRGEWQYIMGLSSSGVPSTIIRLATSRAGCDCNGILTMEAP